MTPFSVTVEHVLKVLVLFCFSIFIKHVSRASGSFETVFILISSFDLAIVLWLRFHLVLVISLNVCCFFVSCSTQCIKHLILFKCKMCPYVWGNSNSTLRLIVFHFLVSELLTLFRYSIFSSLPVYSYLANDMDWYYHCKMNEWEITNQKAITPSTAADLQHGHALFICEHVVLNLCKVHCFLTQPQVLLPANPYCAIIAMCVSNCLVCSSDAPSNFNQALNNGALEYVQPSMPAYHIYPFTHLPVQNINQEVCII